MFTTIDPNAEVGPIGMFIGAGFLALVACGTLVSGLHPRFRPTAQWRGGLPRSVIGSLAFSIGLLIMCVGLVVRGMLNQHGPFTGVVLWLFCGGALVLVSGLIYDLVQNIKKR